MNRMKSKPESKDYESLYAWLSNNVLRVQNLEQVDFLKRQILNMTREEYNKWKGDKNE